MTATSDIFWMQHALELANQAATQAEVPVGAVLIYEDKILGSGSNCPISHCDPTAHAEVMALRHAAKNLGNYRLIRSTLYVTLEPCLMCVGAMIHARIQRLVFGAHDPKTGAVVSVCRALDEIRLNHRVTYEGGVLAEDCGEVLSNFFRERR